MPPTTVGIGRSFVRLNTCFLDTFGLAGDAEGSMSSRFIPGGNGSFVKLVADVFLDVTGVSTIVLRFGSVTLPSSCDFCRSISLEEFSLACDKLLDLPDTVKPSLDFSEISSWGLSITIGASTDILDPSITSLGVHTATGVEVLLLPVEFEPFWRLRRPFVLFSVRFATVVLVVPDPS